MTTSGETGLSVDDCIEGMVDAGFFGFEMMGEFDGSEKGHVGLYIWRKFARQEGRGFSAPTATEVYRKAHAWVVASGGEARDV